MIAPGELRLRERRESLLDVDTSPGSRKNTTRRLYALASLAAVLGASFLKIFPFSGQLIGTACALLITWFQNPSWISAWFRRAPLRRAGIGVLVGLVAVIGTDLTLVRVLPRIGLSAPDFSRFHSLHGHWATTTLWIVGIWLLVAPSEEVVDRGFLINQWNLVIGSSPHAPVFAVIASSLTFGLVHSYEGAAGVITNLCAGLWFGWLYLHQRRNLWANILVHGLADSAAILAFFLGWL